MQSAHRIQFASFLAASALAAHAGAHDVRVVEIPPFELTPLASSEFSALANPAPNRSTREVALSSAIDRIGWDEVDGVVWARGRDYKASFGPEGATIVPFLGSDAPRNYPVTFSLARATIGGVDVPVARGGHALRTDATVRFERGAVDEVYDLSLGSVEQSFDVAERLGAGELVVDVAWAGELRGFETADGLRFANERGGLDYTGAIAIDARGRVLEIESRLVDGAIRLTVPASFLDAATYPVRVDPTFTPYAVGTAASVEYSPDVVYDAGTQRALVAWEYVYSSNDHDILYQVVDSNGVVVTGDWVDITTNFWSEPSIGSQRAQSRALIACTIIDPIAGTSTIGGRIALIDGSMATQQLSISSNETGSKSQPDVGGDSSLSPAGKFCVTWTRTLSSTSQRVNARLFAADGTPQGLAPIEFPILYARQFSPRISNSNDGVAWSIVCQGDASPTNQDIVLARVPADGSGLIAGAISSSADDDFRPNVSTMVDGSNRFVVTFERRVGSNSNVAMLVFKDDFIFETGIDLTNVDGQSASDTVYAGVETDGSHILIAYTKRPGTLHLTEASMIQSAPPLISIIESIDVESNTREDVSIASLNAAGVVSRRQAVAYSRNDDIWLALVDDRVGGIYLPSCYGDGSGSACPCGNYGAAGNGCANSVSAAGARLTGSGDAVIGPDTFVLTGTGMPSSTALYFQGTNALATPSAFGDGLLCIGTAIVRLGTKFNSVGQSQYPGPGDVSVSVRGLVPAVGGLRYYQVWYRNAANYCTSSTFNLTNAMGVVFTP